MVLTVNIFDTVFDKVIVYQSDPATGIGSYYNAGKFGTRGLETVYQYRGEKASLMCNYSFYQVSENNVASYAVALDEDYFLAFPQHRLNLITTLELSDMVSVTPSLSFFGDRYGYAYDEDAGSANLQKFDPTTLINLNLRIVDWLKEGTDISLGVRNITDTDYDYIQPYDGGHAPLPSQTRSIYLSLLSEF